MDFDLLYIKFVQSKLSKIAYLPNKLKNLTTGRNQNANEKPSQFYKKKK